MIRNKTYEFSLQLHLCIQSIKEVLRYTPLHKTRLHSLSLLNDFNNQTDGIQKTTYLQFASYKKKIADNALTDLKIVTVKINDHLEEELGYPRYEKQIHAHVALKILKEKIEELLKLI